jgi:hypothetical protein
MGPTVIVTETAARATCEQTSGVLTRWSVICRSTTGPAAAFRRPQSAAISAVTCSLSSAGLRAVPWPRTGVERETPTRPGSKAAVTTGQVTVEVLSGH